MMRSWRQKMLAGQGSSIQATDDTDTVVDTMNMRKSAVGIICGLNSERIHQIL